MLDPRSGFEFTAERQLKGKLKVTDEAVTVLQSLADAGSLPELKCKDTYLSPKKLSIGSEASFVANAPKGYFENLSELIQRHPTEPPSEYKVFDLDDEQFRLPFYLQAAKLGGLLKILAGSVSTDGRAATLFAKDKVEIPFAYSTSDLQEIKDLDTTYEKLICSADLTPEQARLKDVYVAFFTQGIYDTVHAVAKGQRFAHLIEHFSDCLSRFRQSFRIFSEEGNKAIERYEEKRAGMISALNSILATIQTSLIGVPLAGILALKEMKPSDGDLSYENAIIATAVTVVGLLLLVLSIGQGKALAAIGLQYSQLKRDIDKSGGALKKIDEALTAMKKHYELIVALMLGVRLIIIVFIGSAIAAMWWR